MIVLLRTKLRIFSTFSFTYLTLSRGGNVFLLTQLIIYRPQLMHSFKLGSYDVSHFASGSVVLVQNGEDGKRQMTCYGLNAEPVDGLVQADVRILWGDRKVGYQPSSQVTSMLPVELDLIVLGYGKILRSLSFFFCLTHMNG